MTKRTTLVFVGPTLPAAEVRALLPGAEVRPPAAVGDALAAIADRPRTIALIDGYFERMAAVWHKELLLALERGIAVYGAASMGALRAAELAPFGMIGAGAIYKAYARGTLTADDEVAVAHLPAAQGYRPVSDALVNLRHGLALARRRGVITARTHDRLIEVARGWFYRERTWARLVAEAPVARREMRHLETWLATTPPPDLKAEDARILLRLLSFSPPRRRVSLRVPRTWALRQLVG
ncbi:MAG: TfuA-like protein [Kofleriaceae bacterium]